MATDEIKVAKNDVDKTNLPIVITREALYALVWSEPMLKVAAKFSVSSSYMARVCTSLNVPRPERGYWAKLAVGKALPKPPLPDARPGDELVWPRNGQHVEVDWPLPRPPSMPLKRRIRTSIPRSGQHPLIEGVKTHFEEGRIPSYSSGYIKPYKKILVDLVVSRTGLDKALSFANQLFWQLEEQGYRVIIAPSVESFKRAEVDEHEIPVKNRGYSDLWSPWRCTIVYVGTVAVGLTIIEMSEETEVRYIDGQYIREHDYVPVKKGKYILNHGWTTKKDFPTGRLCLQAYSPYPRAKWIKRWQESKNRDLNSQIKTIRKELEQKVADIARLVKEGEHQATKEREEWKAQQEQWQREEEKRRVAEALKESKKELHQIIDNWAEANRIEQFFQDTERRAVSLGEDEKFKVLERLKIARALIGSTDALARFMEWKSPDER
jgi:hypothetical protein